jgi:23S rRNA maturation-related 3'-5' exoribonuclease YhaM
MDLASITKHPGMVVLLDKLIRGHAQQQLHKIYEVKPEDPDRVTKLDAISSTAYAMNKMEEYIRRELEENWDLLARKEKIVQGNGAGQ